MAIVEAVGPRDGHRSALGRAAASLRQAGLEGHFGAQAGRFLELLVECGRETAPAGELPLTDLLYVGHWTRRLLPDDGEARIPRMPPESPSGTAAVARRPGGRAGAPTAMELAMRQAEARRGAGR